MRSRAIARGKQATFALAGFDVYRRVNQRAHSLAETNLGMPTEKAALHGQGLWGRRSDRCQRPEARKFVRRRAATNFTLWEKGKKSNRTMPAGRSPVEHCLWGDQAYLGLAERPIYGDRQEPPVCLRTAGGSEHLSSQADAEQGPAKWRRTSPGSELVPSPCVPTELKTNKRVR